MTHDTIMHLAAAYATEQLHAHYHPAMEARAALSTALSELVAERDALQSERDMWEATAEATVDFDALRYRWLTRSGFKYAEIELSERGEERIPCVDYKITFSIPEPVGTEFDEQEDGWTLTDIDAAIDSAMKGTPT